MLKAKLLLILLLPILCFGQEATIIGKLTNTDGFPISDANIYISEIQKGTSTDRNGKYTFVVPANTQMTLKFTHASYWPKKKSLNLKNGQRIVVDIQLTSLTLDEIEVKQKSTLGTNPIDKIRPSEISTPSAMLEATLQFQGYGVSQNSELSSGYNVRGGNFNENLIYVNGIEVYRPFLARSGQQEGLSFINPYMVESILFSAGGFESKYGDRLSSVLDVQYGESSIIDKSASSITMSLLGTAAHTRQWVNPRFNFNIGGRYRTNSYLLGALDTKGEYKPVFADMQGLFNFDINEFWRGSFYGTYSMNKYRVVPENRETNFGSINEALKFTVFYDGQEITQFRTNMAAFSFVNTPNDSLKLQFITSLYRTIESEHFDLFGQYKLEELERDLGADEFGEVAYSRGVGGFLEHARNDLDAYVANAYHKGAIKRGKHTFEWGTKFQLEQINDKINEWNYLDSARFNVPHPADSVGYTDPSAQPYQELHLSEVTKNENSLTSFRVTGYAQDRIRFIKPKTIFFSDTVKNKDTSYVYLDTLETSDFISLTAGIRSHYWSYNQQNVVSPRVSLDFKPAKFFLNNDTVYRRDLNIRLATGFYYQPPFYRAARNLQGDLNPEIRAQKSIHFVLGGEYTFVKWSRKFRFGTELYYKHLTDIIPYEIDNVRIRYMGENNAKGYATGIDLKLNGQFIKGIESYATLSYLKTEEDIIDDYYYDYYNSDGELIKLGYTANNVAIDSVRMEPGYIPRPTDQRVSLAMFFQDRMPKEWDTEQVKWSTMKVNLMMVFGTRLPYGPPGGERYQDTLRSSFYKRVDIGFSKDLLTNKSKLKEDSFWKKIDRMWVSLEVFNLLDIANIINYSWITDAGGRQYSIPSYLTPRRINLKLAMQF